MHGLEFRQPTSGVGVAPVSSCTGSEMVSCVLVPWELIVPSKLRATMVVLVCSAVDRGCTCSCQNEAGKRGSDGAGDEGTSVQALGRAARRWCQKWQERGPRRKGV